MILVEALAQVRSEVRRSDKINSCAAAARKLMMVVLLRGTLSLQEEETMRETSRTSGHVVVNNGAGAGWTWVILRLEINPKMRLENFDENRKHR